MSWPRHIGQESGREVRVAASSPVPSPAGHQRPDPRWLRSDYAWAPIHVFSAFLSCRERAIRNEWYAGRRPADRADRGGPVRMTIRWHRSTGDLVKAELPAELLAAAADFAAKNTLYLAALEAKADDAIYIPARDLADTAWDAYWSAIEAVDLTTIHAAEHQKCREVADLWP